MIKTKSRLFSIMSNNALNGSYKSQVLVSLPDLTFHNDNIQNAYLSVVHCEVPNSFYIVNYTNNQLVISGSTYVIPVGNYNASTLITVLLTILPAGYGLTYSNITNKYTMTYSSSFTINASSVNCKINTVMGLGTTDLPSVANTVVFPFVVNFLPLPRLNFRSDYFKFGNYNSKDGSGDIFLPLQNNAGQNSMINYINQTQVKNLIIDRSITIFTINVTDDNGNLVNFNNVDWYMTFQIDVEYLETPRLTNFSNIVAQPPLF